MAEVTSEQKFLKANNEWDVDGLRAARTKEDGDEVLCTETKIPLYYVNKDGAKIMLHSFGFCVDCNKPFQLKHLKTPDAMERPRWPIHFMGFSCLDCHNKD